MAYRMPNPRIHPCVARRRREMSIKALFNPSERSIFTLKTKWLSLKFLQEAYFWLQKLQHKKFDNRKQLTANRPVSHNLDVHLADHKTVTKDQVRMHYCTQEILKSPPFYFILNFCMYRSHQLSVTTIEKL